MSKEITRRGFIKGAAALAAGTALAGLPAVPKLGKRPRRSLSVT